ncbi:MAG: thymidine phosphorylase [Candidatus Aenigmarchaeota archaeon]|nr:thymidine phosphorylase [Candidatus Aenigmarchaeota archaeon]
MRLKVILPQLDAGGKTIAIINKEDAEELGVYPLDRIVLKKGSRCITVIVNITNKFVKRGEIVVYEEVREMLSLKNGNYLTATPRGELISKQYIKKKVLGKSLGYKEFKAISLDVMERDLNDLELASFITALTINGMSLNENVAMTKVMADMSDKLQFPGIVADKHSIGGVPGDKTSLLVVPIAAAAGLTVPKTSSRAITDPAGTADRMEVLAPVDLGREEMKKVVKKTMGCLVWGGSVELAPVDDLFIQIERPLSLDPLLIPSVISKKKVVGAMSVVIDIPEGLYAKVKTGYEFRKMSRMFMHTGKKLGIRVKCVKTSAEQPVGYALGPSLEAREALQSLINIETAPYDLIQKVTRIAGEMLKINRMGDEKTVVKIWKSGIAEKKMRQIIEAQGGDPMIMPEDIEIGKYSMPIRSVKSGIVKAMNNKILVYVAKAAGAPKDKAAGILLNKKLGSRVRKNDILFTIYAQKSHKFRLASRIAKKEKIFEMR